MCGIAGLFKRNGDGALEDVSEMSKALIHRGPDAHGTFHEAGFALAHQRLSIIDLDKRSDQPMHSSC